MSATEQLYNLYLITSAHIVTVFTMLPILIAIWKWKYLNKPLKVFFIYCVLTLGLNLFEIFLIWASGYSSFKVYILQCLKYFKITNTNFLFIFYSTKNFIYLGLFFTLILKNHINISWLKPLVVILVISTWINYLFIEGYKVYSTFNHTVDTIFCFALPLYFLWFIFNENPKVPIVKNPYFWIGLGLISTAIIAFYLYLTGDKIRSTDKVLFFKLAIIKNIIIMIEQVLEAIGFYYARYTKYLPENTSHKTSLSK